MLNPRDPTIVANKKAMKSFENSKTDYEIFSGLAERLGLFRIILLKIEMSLIGLNLYGIESTKDLSKRKFKFTKFRRILEKRIF